MNLDEAQAPVSDDTILRQLKHKNSASMQIDNIRVVGADSDEAAPLFRDDCAPGFRDDLAPCFRGFCRR